MSAASSPPVTAEVAAALAGPPRLGRSVLVRPGASAPTPWLDYERILVRPTDFSADVGVRLREIWLTRTRAVIELDGELPDAAAVWHAPWWELTPGLTMRAEVLAHLLTANVVDARDPRGASFAPVSLALRHGAQRCVDTAAGGLADGVKGGVAGDVIVEGSPVWCDGGPLDRACVGTVDAGTRSLAAPVIPATNLAIGNLRPVGSAVRSNAQTDLTHSIPVNDHTPINDRLADDQRGAVRHLGGAACIVAPAGSGKTRVLTERARYLVRDLGIAAGSVCLVAFNVRARREMQERTTDLAGIEVRTLNSLALAICNGSGPFARPSQHRRVDVIDEPGVRVRLDGLIKRRRQAMTDPFAPWLEALSASRLGLREPAEVERDFQPDVPDFATAAPRFIEEMSASGLVDFDQQVIRAIEILLTDPLARAAARRVCGVLLVDEFQDLTPAHLLMIRLLAGPRADVFAVGDDDQTIYGYAGASPQWLIDFHKYFPGADRHHLHVNYRCPTPVIGAASNLLSHNLRRIDKQIIAPTLSGHKQDTAIAVKTTSETAAALREAVTSLIDSGAKPSDIAVLTRVNSTLLVPQVVLADMGVPADAPLGRRFIERTGIAGALAWLRLAVAPSSGLPSGALCDAARRPPRGISPRVIEWIGEQRSIAALRALAERMKDERTLVKISEYADDVDMLRQRTMNEQLSARSILELVRDELGLGLSLDTRLDASRRSVDRSAHGDDLRALISVADLHPDPASFAVWLSGQLDQQSRQEIAAGTEPQGSEADDTAPRRAESRSAEPNRAVSRSAEPNRAVSRSAEPNRAVSRSADTSAHGLSSESGADQRTRHHKGSSVRLSTVHRVKGLEWPHVIIYEASEGLFPHRLAHDMEEERRIFHVALTRCSESVTLVCDELATPFLAELNARRSFDISAESSRSAQRARARGNKSQLNGRTKPQTRADVIRADVNRTDPGRFSQNAVPTDVASDVPYDQTQHGRAPHDQALHDPALHMPALFDQALFEVLREWRLNRSRADSVPAFVVFSDAVLIALATRRPSNNAELLAVPGIGPVKIDRYGDEVLPLIAQHG